MKSLMKNRLLLLVCAVLAVATLCSSGAWAVEDEASLSCDTMVALGNSTIDGSVCFAKNSDRANNE